MFNLSETVKIVITMNHSQQLELSLGKRTELICTPNKKVIWSETLKWDILYVYYIYIYKTARRIGFPDLNAIKLL